MAILFVLTLGLLFPAHTVGQASPTASVRGAVLDATTNGPITNAEVTLVNVTERGNTATTTTGRNGEFLFSGVQPGQYVLRPRRDGYLDDSGVFVSTASRQFVLGPGQALTDKTLRLGAAGAIAGLVQDEERQGVANTLVSAFRFQYDDIRQAWMWISIQEAVTDERGEFRIGDLPPGRYIVRTTPLSDVPLSDSLARLGDSDEFRTLPRTLRLAFCRGQSPLDECRGARIPTDMRPSTIPTPPTRFRPPGSTSTMAAKPMFGSPRRSNPPSAFAAPLSIRRLGIGARPYVSLSSRRIKIAGVSRRRYRRRRYVRVSACRARDLRPQCDPVDQRAGGHRAGAVSEPSTASHPRGTDHRPGQAGRPRGSHRRQ